MTTLIETNTLEQIMLRGLYDKATDFFADPNNQKEFEQWKAHKEVRNANYTNNGINSRELRED